MWSGSWSRATRDAWDVLCDAHYLPLSQSWQWGEAKRATGQRVERFALGGRTGMQLELRRGVAWAAGAPIGDVDASTWMAFGDLARRLRRPILLSPTTPLPGAGSPVAGDLFHSGTVLFELSNSELEMRKQLHGYWRNHLSKAERAGTEVVDGTRSELLTMLDELAQRKGFKVRYDAHFVEALRASFGKGFVIRVARHSGRNVGVLLDLRAGDTGTSFLGAATPEGRELRVAYLLAWDALRRYRESGARTYDMGNIGRDRSTGPSAFKVRSGGDIVEFPGTYLIGGGARAYGLRSFLGLKRLRSHGRPVTIPTSQAGADSG